MPLPDIQLDDRTFESIVTEAKRRIPGYTPEWTDFNESDPGLTLVQLFAWLTEMQAWRLNRVPEKNIRKLLDLLGIQLAPPKPAQAELSFTLAAKTLERPVLIPQGTRVALSEQIDGQPVIFETDDNLYATGVELKALQSFDGQKFELLDEANRVTGQFFYPFGKHPQKGTAFYLGFDQPFPAGQYTFTMHAYTADLLAEGQAIGDEFVIPPPPAVTVWEYLDEQQWRLLQVIADGTANLTRTGTLSFIAPEKPVKPQKFGLLRKDSDKPLIWFRCRIEQEVGAGYLIPPRLEDVLLNTITATNAVTETNELLGASTGLPFQQFKLAHAPVLPERFALRVDEGEGFELWQRVEDFGASKSHDKHFILDFASGEIFFGDGKQGKIPARLFDAAQPEEDLPNLRVTNYRWGGGARGNAGARKITALQSAVPYLDSVTNLRPALGGEDEETIAAAQQRAPASLRSQSRAVTAEDFEFLARQTPGVRIRRAHALPLRHPDFAPRRPALGNLPAEFAPVPGVVTVLVVPESLPGEPKPLPSEDTLKLVARWLRRHRLVTTELHVAAPKYRKVEIRAEVKVKPTANSGTVVQALNEMLGKYFHPLSGGANNEGWGFGETISFAEIYRRILNTDGVLRIVESKVLIVVDEKPQGDCQDISLNEDELVYSTEHRILASYE